MEQTEADRQTDQPVLNIIGEKVALGPMTGAMVPMLFRWLNDFSVTVMSGDVIGPISRETVEARYDRHSKDERDSKREFAIFERASMQLIGFTHLRDIDKTMQIAELGITIGEKDYWGRGYGTETVILLLDYGFTVLGLHNVLLSTYGYNERAVRAYTRAGFRVIGRRREAARLGNQLYDVIYMDCLSSEFRNPFKQVIDLP